MASLTHKERIRLAVCRVQPDRCPMQTYLEEVDT